ncbi:methionyl-tRNA formyltransferase [Serratia fonticola]|uniref:Methionyl-tRNA formyltransferase n=1 Tax=Serratia fonticola TaxID=47917 RepID=A0A542D0W2_SERFO|nr:formyltransferase family protein [Serratia fonticola]TQI81264.1 methionyl-tRNA formyltransferase [Serratia fonticola]TQI96712.1 methionyl-tRNA formyltransferase [Serratia fonticola]TVZ71208.1 methionyl-tRNA formyltransferase [Serratia fonticola]
MPNRQKVVLFSEVNSKLGSPFLRVLSAHPAIELVAVVTSPHNSLCGYFVNDPLKVDIDVEATALGIPVLRPEQVSIPAVVEQLTELEPDYFIVANFQQILSRELLAIPRIAPINFHPSPLPRYAGLAPFYWVVRNGDRHSAISAIRMEEGLDTGPIIMQRQIALSGLETGIGLRNVQEQQNVLMLLDLIPLLATGSFTYVPQDMRKRTYCGRPREQDYLLDFTLDAKTLYCHTRAGYRHPGAHFFMPDGSRVVVLSMALCPEQIGDKLGSPGSIRHTTTGTFIAASDEWLQLLTIDINGIETCVTPSNISATAAFAIAG